ncbi:MAG: type 4a pilus biogenesis protein PilO [Pseudomonadota bacterium]
MLKASLFEKIEKIKRPQRMMIFLGTFVLLAGGFFSLVYMPKATMLSRTTEEISNLKQKIAAAKKKAGDLKTLEAEEREVNAKFMEALKLLPNNREIPSLLKGITELGKDSRLEFPLFSPQGERPQDFYVEIPVNIVVSGKYHDIAAFFDEVGRMDRIVNILDISMKPQKELSTMLVASCTAVTYRFKGKEDEKSP